MARQRGDGLGAVNFGVVIRSDQVRRYRVCRWVSSYLDLRNRVTWAVIVDRGIDAVESELMAMVELRGLDWDRLERLAMERTRDSGVDSHTRKQARIEGGGSDGVSGGGMPLVGGGGMIDG